VFLKKQPKPLNLSRLKGSTKLVLRAQAELKSIENTKLVCVRYEFLLGVPFHSSKLDIQGMKVPYGSWQDAYLEPKVLYRTCARASSFQGLGMDGLNTSSSIVGVAS
jgi:hypothetical protein